MKHRPKRISYAMKIVSSKTNKSTEDSGDDNGRIDCAISSILAKPSGQPSPKKIVENVVRELVSLESNKFTSKPSAQHWKEIDR